MLNKRVAALKQWRWKLECKKLFLEKFNLSFVADIQKAVEKNGLFASDFLRRNY